ncbi:methylated-DNA--[protein]-cysteine S-methyltransferase [Geosporobacter ferrireducens]|uniref:Methylated-DNA--protein-cysteine methyltransferase n=1 Tax=Geosporobacter ferrireducens TaxID=1424294 RepID=A0A1D8GNL5_9FIRM|nr:methylated-DNA--[protein]-cysteine S-methyltransferase [Geosporobacter ferrireducens]AOT72520.1 cysteine methyltransferase [Geosporobacter ferrireducens]
MPIYIYKTPIGRIGIAEKDGSVTNLYFENDELPQDIETCETPILKEAAGQLRSYLSGELQVFSIPLTPFGTDFMKRVWACLYEIPYGETVSYKEIAVKIGSPNAARAVGLANHRNPIPIFIPCHRVIGTSGSLTGYRGGLKLKKQLLDMEASMF